MHRGGYRKDTHVFLHTVCSMRVYAATSASSVILHSSQPRSKTMKKSGKKTNHSPVKHYRFQCLSQSGRRPTYVCSAYGWRQSPGVCKCCTAAAHAGRTRSMSLHVNHCTGAGTDAWLPQDNVKSFLTIAITNITRLVKHNTYLVKTHRQCTTHKTC